MPGVKKIKSVKVAARVRRKVSIRKKLEGTAERPRLSVFRSAKHIYVQAVDDITQTVIASASDLEDAVKASPGKKKDKAKAVGKSLAQKLLAKNISLCVFDRNGFIYHGRVSAVADGAREGGLKF
jgi:large subunit ribosomal protein L18